MAQLSSEEALNGIFNILDTMVSQQQAEKNKTPETKADETIISLLTGVVEGAKDNAIGNASEQLEKLAKVLHALSDLNEESMKTISSTIGAINNLTKLDLVKINSIMNDFNPDAGKKIGKFVSNIYESIKEANLSDKEIKELIQPVGTLMKGLTGIINSNIFEMKTSLNPFKGRMLGRQLGQFINAFVNAAGDTKIDDSMKNISSLLDPLAKFADPNSKVSLFKFIKVFNKVNANLIGNFFKTIVESVPNDKEVSKTVYAISELLKVLFKINPVDVKAFNKAVDLLDKSKVKKLNEFISELCGGEWKTDKLKTVNDFMISTSKTLLLVVAALGIVIAVSALTSLGDAIIGFSLLLGTVWTVKSLIKSLVKDLTNKDVQNANKIIQSIGYSISLLLGVISITALVTSLIGIVPVLTGFLIMKFTVSSVKNLILALNEKEIKSGLDQSAKILYGISALLVSMSAALMIVTLTAKYNTIGDITLGFLLIAAFTAGSIFAVKSLANIEGKELNNVTNALLKISAVFAIISLVSATLLVPIGKKACEVIKGAGVVLGIIGISILGVKWLSNIQKETLESSIYALAALTVAFTIISLVSFTLLIPIGKRSDEVWSGVIIIGTIIGFFTIIVGTLSLFQKDVQKATNTLLILTGVFTLLSVVSLTLLIPIGKKAGDVTLGALILAAIIGVLVAGTWFLSTLDTKNILKALAVTVALAVIYVGIALITKDILIPIGQQTKQAGLGAGVTLLIIGALILGTYLLSQIDGANVLKALTVTAVLAFILLGISLITKEILIPIGKESETALYGAGIVLGLIAAMGVIMLAIGELTQKKEVQEALIRGGLTMMGIAAVLLITGYATGIFAKNAKDVWELNTGGAVLLGGTLMLAILGSMGAVMYFVGDKLMKPAILKSIAIGSALMSGIGVLLAIIGETVGVFAKNAALVSQLNKQGDLLGGVGLIVLLLGAFTAIFAVVGSLTAILPLILAGAATMTVVSGAIFIIAGVMSVFLSVIQKTLKFKEDQIRQQGSIMVAIFDVIFNVIKKACPNPLQLAQAAAAVAFAVPVTAVFGLLRLISDNMQNIVKTVTPSIMSDFVNIVIGKDKNDKNSILGSMTTILDTFNNIKGVLNATIISKLLRPIINTISQWVDVVIKVAKMNYISGYDDNGKPIFSKIDPGVFGLASTNITNGFSEFLKSLNDGFDKLGIIGALSINIISKLLKPVIGIVSQFVDVVMKVATGTYVKEFDENGKPVYEHLDPKVFGDAATQVSNRFANFLTELNKGFSDLSPRAIIAMAAVQDLMKPVMTCVKDFVDTVIKVATMTVITGYDKDGHPEFEQIDLDKFLTAGVYVAETFGLFLTNLAEGFSKLDYNAVYAMNAVRNSIAPVMEGVSSFVDSILKLTTGQYVDSYTESEKGNLIPNYKRVTEQEYLNAAIAVAFTFSLFVEQLTNSFEGDFWGSKTEDALEAIGGSIGPVMEGVGSYVESILQLATGTYIEKYEKDKDGKYVPVYKHLTTGMFIEAAVAVQLMFLNFINALVDKLKDKDFVKKLENASEAIQNSIAPIMGAVKDFSDALKPFLGLNTAGVGKDGKPNKVTSNDLICLQPGKIKQIATNIGNAFTSFISIIANDLVANEEKYGDVESSAGTVSKILKTIKGTTDNLVKIIKSMTDDKGNVMNGNAAVTELTGRIDQLVTYFSNNTSNFETSGEVANNCKTFIARVYAISKLYKLIIDKLSVDKDKNNPTDLINNFTGNLDKLINKFTNYSNSAQNIDTAAIQNLMTSYRYVANVLVNTSEFINRHENMETGIIKFVTNLNKLTSPQFTRQLNDSGGNIRLYTVRLREFTTQIETTTGKVEFYTTTLEKARKALKALDDEIINKEKKRNNALETFANKVNDIANAVYNLQGAFNALDENSIINRFQGVKDLINTVLGNNDNTTNTIKNNTNRNNVNTNNRNVAANNQNNNQRSNTRYINQGMPTSGMVTFEFKDTVLRGFFHSS